MTAKAENMNTRISTNGGTGPISVAITGLATCGGILAAALLFAAPIQSSAHELPGTSAVAAAQLQSAAR